MPANAAKLPSFLAEGEGAHAKGISWKTAPQLCQVMKGSWGVDSAVSLLIRDAECAMWATRVRAHGPTVVATIGQSGSGLITCARVVVQWTTVTDEGQNARLGARPRLARFLAPSMGPVV